jgi:ubiquinone biosynthesis protein COQ9
MDDTAFDEALITAAFAQAASSGWAQVSVAGAAREAALPLERARARFPTKLSILMRFGRMADQAALVGAAEDGTARDRLFDTVMRRFDALQSHREGVRGVMRALPADPGLAVHMALATQFSMGWMLQAAGISGAGLRGLLRTKGMVAVWLYTLRAWDSDASPDLSGTMAALDRALTQAERFGGWLEVSRPPEGPKPFPEEPARAPLVPASPDGAMPEPGAI